MILKVMEMVRMSNPQLRILKTYQNLMRTVIKVVEMEEGIKRRSDRERIASKKKVIVLTKVQRTKARTTQNKSKKKTLANLHKFQTLLSRIVLKL